MSTTSTPKASLSEEFWWLILALKESSSACFVDWPGMLRASPQFTQFAIFSRAREKHFYISERFDRLSTSPELYAGCRCITLTFSSLFCLAMLMLLTLMRLVEEALYLFICRLIWIFIACHFSLHQQINLLIASQKA